MSDAIAECSRCGEPANDGAIGLALDKELPASVPRELRLCSACVKSLERWFRKRARPSLKPDHPPRSRLSSALPFARRSSSSKERRRRWKELQRRVVLTVASLLIFIAAYYWTLSILNRATRVDD